MSIVSDGTLRKLASLVVTGAACMATMASSASIIDQWSSVQVPPPPALKPVIIDRGTTALLLLDFNEQTCNAERRPRCIASIPQVANLLNAARAAPVPVVYSLGGGGTAADILKEPTPTHGEPVVSAGVDNFAGTDLESLLKKKGVKTVVVAGVAAHGAVLYTASAAATRDLKVVVALDGVSADNAYAEQYTAWHLVNAPRIGPSVTLTTIDAIEF